MTTSSFHTWLRGLAIVGTLSAGAMVAVALQSCTTEETSGAGGEGSASGGPGPMVELEPMVVNLNSTDRAHYLKVSISLELTDEHAAKLYEPRKAQARHAVLTSLRALTLAETQDVDEQERIRGRLHEEIEKVIGPQTVQGVYFTDFVTQ